VAARESSGVAEIGETLKARDREEWRAWLAENHAAKQRIWLLLAKKGVPESSVTYEEAVEEALCFGWIDGQGRRLDDRYYALRFTPRRPGSVWAASNKARVEKLIAAGRMTPAGMVVIEAAKARGDWESLPANEELDKVPADLQAALDVDTAAATGFAALAASSRRMYVRWVVDAKRPETRARRIAEIVRRARLGLRPGEPG
jgi:uncharacterized protein YdeI (YjbR/CyaY-like superfamily)